MKKSLLSLTMALCIGLFTSCSQEEIISDNENGEQVVNLSAQLPDNISTRALPGAAKNHQLRCILEVWDKAESGKLITRIEKLGSEAVSDKLQFAFTVPGTTNYQCLLWADFIAATPTSRAANGTNTYTDLYYNTTNLKAVDFNKTDASLFNNASADAFCGVVEKNGTTSSLSVTLKRPFTKLTLTDKSEYLAGCTSLAPTFMAPSKFDISTGKTTSYTEVAATGITPADKTLFSTFIFASADKQKLDKDITIEFTKTDDTTETKTIKADQISLDQNIENNAEANFSTESNVTVDVDINDQYPDPNAMKIGQFVNKDGSVTDAYNAETAIGIIFAVGTQGNDAAANYDETLKDKTIAGYAMALKSTASKAPMPETEAGNKTPVSIAETALIDTDLASYSGIKNTEAIISTLSTASITSELFNTEFTTWKEANVVTGTNLSAWYIPSYQQLVTFIGYFYGAPSETGGNGTTFPEGITQNEDFKKAVEAAEAGTFVTNDKNLLSSSFKTDVTIAAVQFKTTDGITTLLKTLTAKSQNAAFVRPVLTVFKADAAK